MAECRQTSKEKRTSARRWRLHTYILITTQAVCNLIFRRMALKSYEPLIMSVDIMQHIWNQILFLRVAFISNEHYTCPKLLARIRVAEDTTSTLIVSEHYRVDALRERKKGRKKHGKCKPSQQFIRMAKKKTKHENVTVAAFNNISVSSFVCIYLFIFFF